MEKTGVKALFGFGLFLLLIGSLLGWSGGRIVGFLMVAGSLYLGLRPDGTLRKDQVLDTWSVLIRNAQGNADKIFQKTEDVIKKSKAPSIGINKRRMGPSFFRGLAGKKRDFLEVTDQENIRMIPYKIYVSARDYGDNLDVSRYLVFRPIWWQALLAFLPYVNFIIEKVNDLDLFDLQDLTVYTTNVHHCTLEAVEEMMTELKQDPSKIDRKSRGFLGIS